MNLSSQKAPSAKRCIKTARHPQSCPSTAHVRKHREPNGALRQVEYADPRTRVSWVRKHRAPKGALRRAQRRLRRGGGFRARKHRAPKGALRPDFIHVLRERPVQRVRKHRAPKGALRRANLVGCHHQVGDVRKHRAPKGALRPLVGFEVHV